MAARVKPLQLIEMALGGSEKAGAAPMAEKIIMALMNAGWRFYHQDDPRNGLVYGPTPPTIEETVR